MKWNILLIAQRKRKTKPLGQLRTSVSAVQLRDFNPAIPVVAGSRAAGVVGTLPLIYYLLKVLMPPSFICDGSDKRRR